MLDRTPALETAKAEIVYERRYLIPTFRTVMPVSKQVLVKLRSRLGF
ncbi:hypothetical protein [Janthinobacterium sp. PSPC3-1]